MMDNEKYDVIVVGSGPNGLAAAITLAKKGLSVLVLEEKKEIGGGVKSEELTLPGFIHDVCSSIHPLAIGSPFFRNLPLAEFGLEWIQPKAPLAHPFDDGNCLLLEKSLEKTSAALGEDKNAYKGLMSPFVENWSFLENTLLGPLTIPSHPWVALKFAVKALRSAHSLGEKYFKNPKSKGFFLGLAAHSMQPLDWPATSAFAFVLAILGHVYGWPMPKGGARSIAIALGKYLESLGGKIKTANKVSSLSDLPSSRAVLFDLTPKQVLEIAGDDLSGHYKKQLSKYRYGPGVFKIDWALNDPIPWKAKECLNAGTVHIGASANEIRMSEKLVWEGKISEKPYVLLAQHSLFDPTRAPPGKHTAWAYCHVPYGSTQNVTKQIEDQVERFAPGFKDTIIAKSTKNTEQMTQFNSNYIGGDINGGVQDLYQLFTRPTKSLRPYATSNPKLFICSSSTPPGGGVHGMCGYHAAQLALKRIFH